MKYIIELPEEVKEKFDNATKDDIYGSYYDYNSVIGNAIKNGTPLSEQPKWIFVSKRLPNNHEYIKNNGLFNVSDGNRSYFGWFDIYNTKKFVKPTIAGFCVDNAVTAWMPLPQPYKAESEEADGK